MVQFNPSREQPLEKERVNTKRIGNASRRECKWGAEPIIQVNERRWLREKGVKVGGERKRVKNNF